MNSCTKVRKKVEICNTLMQIFTRTSATTCPYLKVECFFHLAPPCHRLNIHKNKWSTIVHRPSVLSGKIQRVERKKSTRWKPRVNTLKTEFLPVSSHRGRSSVSADEFFQQTLAHLRFFPYLCILKRDNCQIKKTLREQWRSESKQCALPPWWLACQVLLRTTSR